MLTITLFALIIGCALATHIDPKIVGGKPAKPVQFPYQVSLRAAHNNLHFCGGSIISPQWILTAASCVEGRPWRTVAVVGTNHLYIGGRRYGISQSIIHDGYDPVDNRDDIALLRIDGNFEIDDFVGIIDLASETLDGGLDVTFSGWGYTSYEPTVVISNDLQYIELKSITVAQCREKSAGYPIHNTHQCTTSPTGQGACQGDSGGPLTSGSPPQQVGISVWRYPCAKGYPDVFTNVAAYRSWIRDIAGV